LIARSKATQDHDLGVDEVPPRPADLPDPLVGRSHAPSRKSDERPLQPERIGVGLQAGAPGLVQGVEHLAVDVELELLGRRVADAHGAERS
jgi:hypothetical protein